MTLKISPLDPEFFPEPRPPSPYKIAIKAMEENRLNFLMVTGTAREIRTLFLVLHKAHPEWKISQENPECLYVKKG